MEEENGIGKKRRTPRQLTPLQRAYERLQEAYGATGKVTIEEVGVTDMARIREQLYKLLEELSEHVEKSRQNPFTPGDRLMVSNNF